jgi:hypothetical protein
MTAILLGAAKTGSNAGATSYRAFLWFGALALVLLFLLQGIRMLKGGLFSVNFSRVFGLTLIASLAVALVFATGISDDAKTGAFTLLGTIAGYLAGSKPSQGASGETLL